jgi:signal transduction histidine kinase
VIVLAHAGHWLSALIYAGPVLIVAALVLAAALRQRRVADESAQPPEESES